MNCHRRRLACPNGQERNGPSGVDDERERMVVVAGRPAVPISGRLDHAGTATALAGFRGDYSGNPAAFGAAAEVFAVLSRGTGVPAKKLEIVSAGSISSNSWTACLARSGSPSLTRATATARSATA